MKALVTLPLAQVDAELVNEIVRQWRESVGNDVEIELTQTEGGMSVEEFIALAEAFTALQAVGLHPAVLAKPAAKLSARGVKADVRIDNLRQQGSHILGTVVLSVKASIVSIEFRKDFDFDTGFANPATVNLGTISVPLLGDFPVVALFWHDLVQRTVTIELTIAGLLTIAKKTFKF